MPKTKVNILVVAMITMPVAACNRDPSIDCQIDEAPGKEWVGCFEDGEIAESDYRGITKAVIGFSADGSFVLRWDKRNGEKGRCEGQLGDQPSWSERPGDDGFYRWPWRGTVKRRVLCNFNGLKDSEELLQFTYYAKTRDPKHWYVRSSFDVFADRFYPSGELKELAPAEAAAAAPISAASPAPATAESALAAAPPLDSANTGVPVGGNFGENDFVLIPKGEFRMGAEDGSELERPVHRVVISQPFLLQRTEVTQGQWKAVMGRNPSHFSECGSMCPVETVNAIDIQTFISKLNAMYPGRNYRLPTEAEWEYAARAGSVGWFSGTGDVASMGWTSSDNDPAGGASKERPHPVAQKRPNAWGLYDMHGNVSEWVQDDARMYTSEDVTDPVGNSQGRPRALRGGSFLEAADQARSSNRRLAHPYTVSAVTGFRLARTP